VVTGHKQAAIIAAGNALRLKWQEEHPGIAATLDPMDWAAVAVEAAAPLIAAAQREADAQLAERHGAGYALCNVNGHPYDYKPFADLLREEDPDGAQ
jgi:hypothetical protein